MSGFWASFVSTKLFCCFATKGKEPLRSTDSHQFSIQDICLTSDCDTRRAYKDSARKSATSLLDQFASQTVATLVAEATNLSSLEHFPTRHSGGISDSFPTTGSTAFHTILPTVLHLPPVEDQEPAPNDNVDVQHTAELSTRAGDAIGFIEGLSVHTERPASYSAVNLEQGDVWSPALAEPASLLSSLSSCCLATGLSSGPQPNPLAPPIAKHRSIKMLLGVHSQGRDLLVLPQLVDSYSSGLRPGTFASAGNPDLMDADDFFALDTIELAQNELNGMKNLLLASPAMPVELRAMQQQKQRWSLQDFRMIKHLHVGYSSDVVVGACQNGFPVCLKVYNITGMPDQAKVQLLRELTLHHALDYPGIIPLHAVFMEQGLINSGTELVRYNQLVMVMELAEGGSLVDMMVQYGGRINEYDTVVHVLQPLLQALQYLHARSTVHRDIKPANILFDGNGVLKLCDFGLSLDLYDEIANTCAGTVEYMAPEVLLCPPKDRPDQGKDGCSRHSHNYGLGCDVWSLGVVTYEMLVGVALFGRQSHHMVQEIAWRIMAATCESITLPASMSPEARDFISKCLTPRECDRPTVQQLLAHPLICKYKDSRPAEAGPSRSAEELFPGVPCGDAPGEGDDTEFMSAQHPAYRQGHGNGAAGGSWFEKLAASNCWLMEAPQLSRRPSAGAPAAAASQRRMSY